MAPPRSIRRESGTDEQWRRLRRELDALADALVDAGPADRPALHARVTRAVDIHQRSIHERHDLATLLHHMLTDLSGEAAPIDTLYYARQLVVVAERLPN